MRLISLGSAYPEQTRETCRSKELLLDDEVAAATEPAALLILRASTRESAEAVDDVDPELANLITEIEPRSSHWEEQIASIYEMCTASVPTDLRGFQRAFAVVPPTLSALGCNDAMGTIIEPTQILIAMGREEIETYILFCEATLQGIEDWEYDLRMGVSKTQVIAVVDGLRRLL